MAGKEEQEIEDRLAAEDQCKSNRPSGDDNDLTDCEHHVCAIGASAGGLAALQEFFEAVPVDLGVVYVVIQHLSPDHESRMPELLSRVTSMPVLMVKESRAGMEVCPDHVYLIPPAKILAIQNGRLVLSERIKGEQVSLPIDRFFISLANDQGRFGIAIVLSGTGSDGAGGLVNVHKAGGLVLAQDTTSAKFVGMPLAALETGYCDLIAAPASLAGSLSRYVRQSLSREQLENGDGLPDSELEVMAILEHLRDKTDIDFGIYKLQQVARRIRRRCELSELESVEDYKQLVVNNIDEETLLLRDLLIGVTHFFRDKEAFETLQHEGITKILNAKKDGDEVRVWVAGCATGEEAYSIAMLVHECIRRAGRDLKVKLFATDVHAAAVDAAANGVFSSDAIQHVSAEMRDRYFVRIKEGYQVVASLRQQIVFVRHNLMVDAPFTRMDLISCRNLLIYLHTSAKEKVLSLFQFALSSGGFLFLGSSESLGSIDDEFEPVSKLWKIFRKLKDVQLASQRTHRAAIQTLGYQEKRFENIGKIRRLGENKLQEAYDLILAKILPAGFLIDSHLRLLHTFGNGGDFLSPQSGRHSDLLTDMIHPDVRASLSAAIQHCARDKKIVKYTGVIVTTPSGDRQSYELTVDRLGESDLAPDFFIVTFEDSERREIFGGEISEVDAAVVSRDSIHTLEHELRFTRENLQATIQELESSNEELQATNEEMVASNEELQSTNEELQSVNEELHTVNAEYHRKISQLRELNDDMDNLLRSSDVAVLFLDQDLNIRRYTPQLGDLFHLRSQDIGRSIIDFRSPLIPDRLFETLRSVLQMRDPRTEEIETEDGQHYLIRITPFDSASLTDGVVLNYTNTTLVRQREDTAKRWASIVESTSDCIIAFDLAHTITQWNVAASEVFGYSSEEATGRNFFDLLIPRESRDETAVNVELVRSERKSTEFQSKRRSRDGTMIDVNVRLSPVIGSLGIVGISSIERDITSDLRESRLRTFETAVNSGQFSHQSAPECWADLQEIAGKWLGIRCVWLWKENALTNKLENTHSGFGKFEQEWLGENSLKLNRFAKEVFQSGREKVRKVTNPSVWKVLGDNEKVGSSNGASDQENTPGTHSSEIWQLMVCPLNDNGKKLGVAGFLIKADTKSECLDIKRAIRDVTPAIAKRIGEQLRLDSLVRISDIVEYASDFIATSDVHGTLASLNRAARLITGFGVDASLEGAKLDQFFTPESMTRIVSEGIPQAIRTGSWTGEAEIVDQNGNQIPVSQLITSHRDDRGHVRYISTICRIIAEQKQVESRLEALIRETTSVNEAKTTFLANISHDVRTPMTTVIGMAEELLDRDKMTNEEWNMVQAIRENGLYVTELLNDLLDLSKVEAGKLSINPTANQLQPLLRQTVTAFQMSAKNKGLKLELDLSELGDQEVLIDKVRLRQIVTNLVANAIKFTSVGFVRVAGRINKEQIEITVQDSGCGIEESMILSVFDPYVSTPRSNPRVRGAGLGLAISRRLAEMMGGGLAVQSVAQRGSIFTLNIPLELTEQAQQPTNHGIIYSSDQRSLQGKKILVAEDTPGIQFLVKRILEREGMETKVVANGELAVEAYNSQANSQPFDAVLMDMQMPVLDGYEAVKRMREQGSTIPIIALTASTMPEEKERSQTSGCNDFVSKPIDRDVLLTALYRQLRPDDE
ncbi:MAG: CheR family methyltransferase [Planctomycetota bacterium]